MAHSAPDSALPSLTVPNVATRRLNRAEAKREQIRDLLFPGSAKDIYDRRVHNGYSTVPRVVGLILTLIEQLADKGKNPCRVYSELWFRTYDDKLVEVRDEAEIAYASGLSVRRWRERIEVLKGLGFIKVASSGSRKYAYILLRNPNNVVWEIRQSGNLISEEWWVAYAKRCIEIGYPLPPISPRDASEVPARAEGEKQ